MDTDADAVPTSQILQDLDARATGPVRLADIFAAMGSRVHGMALLILVLPDTLPLPIPSTSTILGLPLVIVAAHLVIHGEGAELPARVGSVAISRRLIHAMARYAGPPLRRVESLSSPRFGVLLHSDRILGFACLYLSLILLLPIPFMNALPAICLAAIALGMIQRDGIFVAIGLAGAAALTLGLAFFADWLTGAIGRISW